MFFGFFLSILDDDTLVGLLSLFYFITRRIPTFSKSSSTLSGKLRFSSHQSFSLV